MRHTGLAFLPLALMVACASPETAESPTEAPPETVAPEGSEAPWEEARRRGVAFRAVGNEPGWLVEVQPDSLVFVTNYGEDAYRFADYATSTDGATEVYRAAAAGDTLTVTRTAADCTDDMSGQPFETTVTVTINGETVRGCGRALEE